MARFRATAGAGVQARSVSVSRLLAGGEVDQRAGQAADERQLQHLGEPLRPVRGVPEQFPGQAGERSGRAGFR
jgi:hypothetical protein